MFSDDGTFGGFVRAQFPTAGPYRLYFDGATTEAETALELFHRELRQVWLAADIHRVPHLRGGRVDHPDLQRVPARAAELHRVARRGDAARTFSTSRARRSRSSRRRAIGSSIPRWKTSIGAIAVDA